MVLVKIRFSYLFDYNTFQIKVPNTHCSVILLITYYQIYSDKVHNAF